MTVDSNFHFPLGVSLGASGVCKLIIPTTVVPLTGLSRPSSIVDCLNIYSLFIFSAIYIALTGV